MTRNFQCSVSFCGGPFDGHRQQLAFATSELAPVVAVPVNRFILELASDETPTGDQAMTSLAFYELREMPFGVTEPAYGYIGSVSPGVGDLGECVARLRERSS